MQPLKELTSSNLNCQQALIHLLHQPLHHPPQLRRRVAGNHLDITNPRPPQRFFLDRVAGGGGGGAIVIPAALLLDRVQRL
jgi:hypothetical protein